MSNFGQPGQVPMSNSGQLERLLIQAFTKPDYSGSAIDTFEAYVNPAELTLSYEVEYDSAQGAGTTASRMDFKKVKPGDLSLTFFLDGTGANGRALDVQQKIIAFKNVTSYNGDVHRPNFLKVAWGKLAVRRCVLKNASIVYKLFKPNGEPLRAVITAVFTDSSDDQTRVALAQDSSPDLTHVRVIKAGDTLHGLCHSIYGDPCYAPRVARANGLNGFRQLPAGTRVVFPPLEK